MCHCPRSASPLAQSLVAGIVLSYGATPATPGAALTTLLSSPRNIAITAAGNMWVHCPGLCRRLQSSVTPTYRLKLGWLICDTVRFLLTAATLSTTGAAAWHSTMPPHRRYGWVMGG